MVPPQSSRAGRFVPVLLPLLLATAGCQAIAGLEPAKKTAESFLAEMQAGHDAEAFALCSAACKQVTSQDDLHKLWQTIVDARGQVNSWSGMGTSWYSGTGGTQITLSYKLSCERGDCAVRLVVVPEGEAWRIQSFRYQLGAQNGPEQKPSETVEAIRGGTGQA